MNLVIDISVLTANNWYFSALQMCHVFKIRLKVVVVWFVAVEKIVFYIQSCRLVSKYF